MRCSEAEDLTEIDFKGMKYGGLLSLTQSGDGKMIINAIKLAYKNELTCFNVVNVENSPITTILDELQK